MDENELKNYAIQSLEEALKAHEKDDLLSIGDGFDEYDRLLPREGIENHSILYIALEFGASWSDSALHGWLFYEGMNKDDWPRLAKILIDDLKSGREVTSRELLEKFTYSYSPSIKNGFIAKIIKRFKIKQSNKPAEG